jgi:hypothetical protein
LLESNTMESLWVTIVPVAAARGTTVKRTLPPTPGAKNPLEGSSGGKPVSGSSEVRPKVSPPLLAFRLAETCTTMFRLGRRSTLLSNEFPDRGALWARLTWFEPNVTNCSANVLKSNFAGSTRPETETVCAGAVALSSLAK